MLGMTKAKIKVLDGANQKLNAVALLGSSGIPCLFNPSDFTVSRSVNYAEHSIPGLDRPLLQFVGGSADIMRFSVVFDTYGAGLAAQNKTAVASALLPDPAKIDVRKFTDPLMKISNVDSDTHAPNMVEFVWGSISFKGYVKSIEQRFTMFSMLGTPTRAVVTIELISAAKNNFVRNSPDRTKARTISEGDRLCSFAYAEYGDCAEWRRIADANGIDNPRRLESGVDIIIPPIL